MAAVLAEASPLDLARRALLEPAGLGLADLERVLGTICSHAVDEGELYFQLAHEESWSLEDGIVKDGSYSIDQGVGVRALAGERTGFAYSDEIVLPALQEAARAARAIARHGQGPAGGAGVAAWRGVSGQRLYLPDDPITTVADADKVEFLMMLDRETRRLDPRAQQVMASLAAVHEIVLIANSDGTLAADVRPLVRLNISVILEHAGRREQG